MVSDSDGETDVTAYSVRPLAPDTWADFAALIERHGSGGWGPPGCWCIAFHPDTLEKQSAAGNRALKQRLVAEGRAHAALVFDGGLAIGWCQYGSPEELPAIYHRKQYEAGVVDLPSYRITCFFVDKTRRRQHVSKVALEGALDLIAEAGGGVVEGYPQDTGGRKITANFLYNGTRSMFERAGFSYDRPKGKNNCVMSKTVDPGSPNENTRP